MSKLEKKEIKGLNITLPYKNKIFELVDSLTPVALKSNAINTIYQKNKKIVGENTDGKGFINSLSEEAKIKVRGKNVFLIGAGGGQLKEYWPN